MKNPAQHFGTARRAFEALCFYAVVALLALAVGFVIAVMVVARPTRSALSLSPLPAVAWEIAR